MYFNALPILSSTYPSPFSSLSLSMMTVIKPFLSSKSAWSGFDKLLMCNCNYNKKNVCEGTLDLFSKGG